MIWIRKTDKKGNVLYDTIKNSKKFKGPFKNKEFKTEGGIVEIKTNEDNLIRSRRLFGIVSKQALEVFQETHKDFRQQIEAQSHTLLKIHAQLSQKIEQVVESPMLKGRYKYTDQIDIVKLKILELPDYGAEILLYLGKRLLELEAHMSSFQILHMGEFVDLQKLNHNIRRLLLNIWHTFDEQFKEKNINYIFQFNDEVAEKNKITLDYKTINAGFYNFFDNVVKYAKPDTNIHFLFSEKDDEFELKIKMTSLIIEEEEKKKIFEFGYRSNHCKDTDGFGIGLFVMKKSLKLNSQTIQVQINPIEGEEKYSQNTFILKGMVANQ